MKISASGVIESLVGAEEQGEVDVEVTFKGRAVDVAQTAKDCTAQVTLHIKGLVAEQLKWGQKLYLTLSTEPPEGS